jgi:hypothetical protein
MASLGEQLPAEHKRIPFFTVAFAFPVSLFWLGGTNDHSISPGQSRCCRDLRLLMGQNLLAIHQCILDIYDIYAQRVPLLLLPGTCLLVARQLFRG